MVKGYDPSLLEPDVWTGTANAYALEPLGEACGNPSGLAAAMYRAA
ncbi:hypothetical protein OE647_11455 [Defluviimonas sp. WL0075]|uniref:Uncharacterized protein n=1 Tax=Albidovulum sediminicola TaxID=2984331 RepID=A0ABT2Z2J9_9RHOB|nr:hypothetical protein [Defluviimonas sp. WL0075]